LKISRQNANCKTENCATVQLPCSIHVHISCGICYRCHWAQFLGERSASLIAPLPFGHDISVASLTNVPKLMYDFGSSKVASSWQQRESVGAVTDTQHADSVR